MFSPLIALMEDQVTALMARGIRAEFINSTLNREQREERYAALARGEYDLVYVTPERMYKREFRAALEELDLRGNGLPAAGAQALACALRHGRARAHRAAQARGPRAAQQRAREQQRARRRRKPLPRSRRLNMARGGAP